MEKPKSRKRLNALQIDILLALYKFRFATRDLIIKYQGLKSKSYTYYRLENLVEQNYIGRKFDNFDKINRQAVIYFIRPEGIKVLKSEASLNQIVLNTMYKDHQRSPAFINRKLTLFKIYNTLRTIYGQNLNFYTQSEIGHYDYFIKPLPDAYLLLNGVPFIVELVDAAKPSFVHKKRLEKHLEFYETGNWDELNDEYPNLLLICETSNLERRMQTTAANLLERVGIEELSVYTTTTKALLALQNPEDAIMSDVYEPEELLTLNQLSDDNES